MKKSLSLFLALVMALSFLSACSSGTDTSADTASPSNTEAASCLSYHLVQEDV